MCKKIALVCNSVIYNLAVTRGVATYSLRAHPIVSHAPLVHGGARERRSDDFVKTHDL